MIRTLSFFVVITLLSLSADNLWEVKEGTFSEKIESFRVSAVMPSSWFLAKVQAGDSRDWPSQKDLFEMTTTKISPQMDLVDDKLVGQSYDLHYYVELTHHNHLKDHFRNSDNIFYVRASEDSILELYLDGQLLLKTVESLSFPLSLLKGEQGLLSIKVLSAGVSNLGLIDAFVYRDYLAVKKAEAWVSVNHWDFKEASLDFSKAYLTRRRKNLSHDLKSYFVKGALLEQSFSSDAGLKFKRGEFVKLSKENGGFLYGQKEELVKAGVDDELYLAEVKNFSFSVNLENDFERASLSLKSLSVYGKVFVDDVYLGEIFPNAGRVIFDCSDLKKGSYKVRFEGHALSRASRLKTASFVAFEGPELRYRENESLAVKLFSATPGTFFYAEQAKISASLFLKEEDLAKELFLDFSANSKFSKSLWQLGDLSLPKHLEINGKKEAVVHSQFALKGLKPGWNDLSFEGEKLRLGRVPKPALSYEKSKLLFSPGLVELKDYFAAESLAEFRTYKDLSKTPFSPRFVFLRPLLTETDDFFVEESRIAYPLTDRLPSSFSFVALEQELKSRRSFLSKSELSDKKSEFGEAVHSSDVVAFLLYLESRSIVVNWNKKSLKDFVLYREKYAKEFQEFRRLNLEGAL